MFVYCERTCLGDACLGLIREVERGTSKFQKAFQERVQAGVRFARDRSNAQLLRVFVHPPFSSKTL